VPFDRHHVPDTCPLPDLVSTAKVHVGDSSTISNEYGRTSTEDNGRQRQFGLMVSADSKALERHGVLASGGHARVPRHRAQKIIRVKITTQAIEIGPVLAK
jgi:hypothetical protein